MPYTAVQERWDTFLAKIEERFHDLLGQAKTVLPSMLEFQDYDTLPFGNAWGGISRQAKELIWKIQDTWQEKVAPAFDEVINQSDEFYALHHKSYYKEIHYPAMEKGLELADRLEKELKRYETSIFAEAARKLQAQAQKGLADSFSCTQCQAPLPVRQQFYRAYFHTCDYCRTVNTFEPGTLARNVEHFALRPLAEETALEEYFLYTDLEQAYRRQRSDRPAVIGRDEVLKAYENYMRKYLDACVEIIPELGKTYDRELQSKIEHVRKGLR